MKCLLCGADGAYHGLNTIECPNPNCMHFKAPVSASGLLDEIQPSIPEIVGSTTVSSPGVYTAVALNLTVKIIDVAIKKNSRLITFIADGDPGKHDKKVELFWWDTTKPLFSPKRPCTVSSRQGFYVAGVNADGFTRYSTHWRCNLDGVPVIGPWGIEAKIS